MTGEDMIIVTLKTDDPVLKKIHCNNSQDGNKRDTNSLITVIISEYNSFKRKGKELCKLEFQWV